MPVDPAIAAEFADILQPTPAAKAPPAAADPFAGQEAPRLDQVSLRWAHDVYWVFENYSSRVTKQIAGTSSRWGLYQHAKKNADQFMGQLVPKAMVLLEKAYANSGDSEQIVIEERKDIRALKAILVAALEEATGAIEH
jgi:hypothetical protein